MTFHRVFQLFAKTAAGVGIVFGLSGFGHAAENMAIEAGPIWNQTDAQAKCPALAQREGGQWTGQWWTTVQGRMSVCQISYAAKRAEEAGPIWNQADANNKCPSLASRVGGKWSGQWWTTVQGQMSVCEILYGQVQKAATNPAQSRTVEAGPIWNQADAQIKCIALAQREGGKWTGQWWTTVQGQMSVCQISAAQQQQTPQVQQKQAPARPTGNVRAVEAGPIWNQADAQTKCPALAQREGGKWTGQWWTTVQGQMSVCQISYAQQQNAGISASCNALGSKKSINSNTAISITFTNKSSSVKQVQWLDYDGKPVQYNTLQPGQSYVQQTYLTHPWMFTDNNGKCQRIVDLQQGVEGIWIQ